MRTGGEAPVEGNRCSFETCFSEYQPTENVEERMNPKSTVTLTKAVGLNLLFYKVDLNFACVVYREAAGQGRGNKGFTFML
jgi:hypothetical protein